MSTAQSQGRRFRFAFITGSIAMAAAAVPLFGAKGAPSSSASSRARR